MDADRIIEALGTLPLSELHRVDTELHNLINRMEAWQHAEPVETRQAHGITYQLEYIKCGKAGCKCENGQGHGPYWYAYWSSGGKTRKQYIGKNYREI